MKIRLTITNIVGGCDVNDKPLILLFLLSQTFLLLHFKHV